MDSLIQTGCIHSPCFIAIGGLTEIYIKKENILKKIFYRQSRPKDIPQKAPLSQGYSTENLSDVRDVL